MTQLLDIHTHHSAPDAAAIISVDETAELLPGQAYSMGLHPWFLPLNLDEITSCLGTLAERVKNRQIMAIGECGLDAQRGAPMALQLMAFRGQAEIAEQVRKPLIIHDVKCHEAILALHKELCPRQQWIIHGFRAKPSVADMFINRGIALSFGEKFNSSTLAMMPENLLYAETDEAPLSIKQIIELLSVSAGRDLLSIVQENMRCLFE